MPRLLAAVAIPVFIAGCALQPATTTAPATGTRYVYVLLGVEGRPVARAITADATCPAILFDGVAQPMAVRAPPAVIPTRLSRLDPDAAKPAAFPLLTCEQAVPAGVARASIDGRALPLPKANPQRIVVLGDTGCRLQRQSAIYQDCNDPARWPFRAVATAAAASAPDLVIHVGDFHYREDACPPAREGCMGSPWGYGWDAWEADFFAPGAALLAAAPWIVVRGNHESCERGGQGWWRFLDPRPLRPPQNCDAEADDAIGDYSEPYAVPLGSGPGATQAIVFDSSLVGLAPLDARDPMYRSYRAQFEQAFALAARSPRNFFVNHHPILGFAPNPGKPGSPYPGNAALQSVLAPLQPVALFPPNVQATIAGHVHLFEAVGFSSPQPVQFVVGNGGDWADDAFPAPFPGTLTPAPGAVIETIVSTNRFGFMTMEPAGTDWKMTARDARGESTITCVLAGSKVACTPPAPR